MTLRIAFLRLSTDWWLPASLVLASGILELFGDAGRALLRFDRTAIFEGEIWRLLSGHFVHLGPSHVVLNAAGLTLVWLLVGQYFTVRQWFVATAICIALIDAGFLILEPELIWYVGMSGFIYGLLAAGVIIGYRSAPRLSILIGAIVILRIAFEQTLGPLPGSEESAGGSVVVDAHLYGILGGVVSAAVIMRRHFKRHKNGE